MRLTFHQVPTLSDHDLMLTAEYRKVYREVGKKMKAAKEE